MFFFSPVFFLSFLPFCLALSKASRQFFVAPAEQKQGGLKFVLRLTQTQGSGAEEYEYLLSDAVIQTLRENIGETTMRTLAFAPSPMTLLVMMDFLAVFVGSKKTRQNLRESERLNWLAEHLAGQVSPEKPKRMSGEHLVMMPIPRRSLDRQPSADRLLPETLSGQSSGNIPKLLCASPSSSRSKLTESANALSLSDSSAAEAREGLFLVQYDCDPDKCGVVRKCFVSVGDPLLYGTPIAEISLFDCIPSSSLVTDDLSSEDSTDSSMGQYVLRGGTLLGQYRAGGAHSGAGNYTTTDSFPILGKYLADDDAFKAEQVTETSVLIKWDKLTPALVTRVVNAKPNRKISAGLNRLVQADESMRAQQQCFLLAADRLAFRAGRPERTDSKFPLLAEKLAHLVRSGSFSSNLRETMHCCSSLERVARDFYETARTYGRVIINEMHLPMEMKTVRPLGLGGVLGGFKYAVRGILFKIPNEKTFQTYPDPLLIANKVQGHELKGLRSYFGWFFNKGLLNQCSFPLAAVIDYKGHRITAMMQLPINGSETLVYGSDDASTDCNVRNSDPIFSSLIRRASVGLNLKPHWTVNGRARGGEIEIASCVDLEGHRGTDNRNYLLDFSRTFPPTYKANAECEAYDRAWPFYHMMRPEFVARYEYPLCSDSFSAFQSSASSARVAEANRNNDMVALATRELKSKIVMMVCKALIAINDTLYSISHEFHRHGLNMRYLGLVYEQIRSPAMYKPTNHNLYLLLQVEALVRVIKAEVRSKMRNYEGQSESGLRAQAVATLNAFFGGGTKDFEKWKKRNPFAVATMVKRFSFAESMAESVCEGFFRSREVLEETSSTGVKTASLTRHAVLVRLNTVMGLGLDQSLLEELKRLHSTEGRSFSHDSVFQDDDFHFVERVKNLDIVERVVGIRHYLAGVALVAEKSMGAALEKFIQAHRTLVQALEANPSDVFLCMLAGDVCHQIFEIKSDASQKQFFLDSCESFYRQAVATDRSSQQAQVRLGVMLARHRPKLSDEAEDHLLRSIECRIFSFSIISIGNRIHFLP